MSFALAGSVNVWLLAAPPVPPLSPPKDGELNDSIRLVPHRRASKSLEAAADLVAQKEWAEASRILQSLLDLKEDAFIQVHRGEEAAQWTSVRAEVNRLLAKLPREGLEVYELNCGPRAKELLAESRKKGDAQVLAEVTQRFLHTKAGAEAAELLGTYYLDRGRPVLAALCFERLLNDTEKAKGSPATWLKAVLAFRRAGDKARAEQAWRQLQELSPHGVELAGRQVSLPDLEEECARLPAEPTGISPHDWAMFQGNPSRSARGQGDAPHLDADADRWVQPTIQRPEAKQWLTQALSYQETRRQGLVFPAGFPVAVRDLLVYRTHAGLAAVEAATGKLRWERSSDWSLEGMTADPAKVVALQQWVTMYLEGGSPGLLYENSTLGTLSTDQTLVFAVDDLAVPPHPSFLQHNALLKGKTASAGPLLEATQSNRLQALELETGKIRWQIGGAGGPFAETFFLGAPLPLGGKLYVMIERNSELRLACLDAATGKLQWSQTLAAVRDRLSLDVGRRLRGVHLAYADGVLVCPTNAGAILGIDLLTHGLLWAKPYRDAASAAELNPDINQRRLLRSSRLFRPDWKDAAPVVQNGKVIFTAPDGVSVYCLNLRDGTTLWKANRADDLYLAGVYDGNVLLVGKHRCRALRLDDGREAWACETGTPSGRGVAGEGIYYVPLRAAAGGQGPEVCAVEIATGKIVGHARTRQQEVPGNLLFCEGKVVSQSVQQIAAYPQLRVKLAQVEENLRKKPEDPAVLAARGELRLSQGDLRGAVSDLWLALEKKPAQDLLPKVREKLFWALTELLSTDFAAAEQHLANYRRLCQVEPSTEASEEERKQAAQETERRRQQLARLVAAGRERQGRSAEALQAYLDFASLVQEQREPAPLGEPAVQARPDVWVRSRLAALVISAHEPKLNEEMNRRWREIAGSKDLAALRRFVAVFDAELPFGQEARLRLAELLAASKEPQDFLEAELNLLQVREAANGQTAARALEALARLLVRNELFEDAAACYAELGGKLLQEAKRDTRLASFLEPAKAQWPEGAWTGRSSAGDPRGTHAILHLTPAGDTLPFFHRHEVALDTGSFQLRLVDRMRGEERCAQALARSQVYFNLLSTQAPRCHYHTAGHIVIVNIGHMVYAYDAAGKKLLWERNLLGPSAATAYHILPDGDGGYRAFFADGRVQTIGQVGPVTASYVCLQTQDGLLALDPLRGEVLWRRGDFPEPAQVFGDSRLLYCVRLDGAGQAEATFAVRAADGSAAAVPDFTAAFKVKQQIRGRQLVLADNVEGKTRLRLFDPATGKDLWQHDFSAKAFVLHSEDPDLAGVVEPDNGGAVTVFDLRIQQKVLFARVEPRDLEKVEAIHLLHDAERYYLACYAPPDAAANFARGPLLGLAGAPAVLINGALYAFDRATGKKLWATPVAHQLLVRKDFAESPVLLCVARYVKLPGAGARQTTLVQTFDKRTGQPIFEQEFPNAAQFHTLRVRPAAGRLELLGYTAKIEYHSDGGATH